MNDQLFRKKSIERVTSPERLHDYLCVTSPRLWMVLAAAIALLLGMLVFSATANLESSLPAEAVVEDGTVFLELPVSRKEQIKPDMPVRVAGKEGKIDYVFLDRDALKISVSMELQEGETLPDGTYDAEIVTETIKPISFLLN